MFKRIFTVKTFVLILFVLMVSAFFWGVWPTPYRYFPVSDPEMHTTARVNRFTGKSSLLGPQGWVAMERKPDIFDKIEAENKATPQFKFYSSRNVTQK